MTSFPLHSWLWNPAGRISLSLATLLLAFVFSADAELVWVDKTVEVVGDARKPELEVRFKFTNTGGKPVEIRRIESSCGCTTTALEKRVYQPQETGEIVAKYTVGTHTGLQRKTLLVVTDDGSQPTTLTLVARIPEVLRITPTVANWTHNEAPKPKAILLELMQDGAIDDISVDTTNTNVTTELVPVTKGRSYKLLVTPKQTDRFLYAKLSIHCRFGREEKSFVTYATVRPSTGER